MQFKSFISKYFIFIALALVAINSICQLAPIAFDIGFAGDDWNHIFGIMNEWDGLFENFLASNSYFAILNRPTPLQPLSLALLHSLFGDVPTGYVLSGIVGLTLSGSALGAFVYRTTRSGSAAIITAIAFCALPLNNQALFHIAAGSGKWQACIYFILSAYLYIDAIRSPLKDAIYKTAASVFLYALSLACYEQSIAFLPLYPIMHLLWAQRFSMKYILLGHFWPHVLISVAYFMVRTVYFDASDSGGYHILTSDLETLGHALLNPWAIPNMYAASKVYIKLWTVLETHWQTFGTREIGFIAALTPPCILTAYYSAAENKQKGASANLLLNGVRLAILGAALVYSNTALFVFLSTWVSERNLVFPTIGLSLLVGSAVTIIHALINVIPPRAVRAILLSTMMIALCVPLSLEHMARMSQSQAYRDAGIITRAVYNGLKPYKGQITKKNNVVVLGIPWALGEIWTFTANYAISGAVRRAFGLPQKSIYMNYAQVALLPTETGYNHYLNIRSYPWGGYVQNYYTQCDILSTEVPQKDYANLVLFIFTNDSKLVRVDTLEYHNEEGKPKSVKLAALQDPVPSIKFKLPRVARVVDSLPDALPKTTIDAGEAVLEYVSISPTGTMYNTNTFSLIWKKNVDEFKNNYRVFLRTDDGKLPYIDEFIVYFPPEHDDKQLCGTAWGKDQYLEQTFLFTKGNALPQTPTKPTRFLVQIDRYDGDQYIESITRTLPLPNNEDISNGQIDQ